MMTFFMIKVYQDMSFYFKYESTFNREKVNILTERNKIGNRHSQHFGEKIAKCILKLH